MRIIHLVASKATKALQLILLILPLSCCTLSNDRIKDHRQEYFEKGLQYYTGNNFDAALKELNQAIALYPGDSASFHARGNVYYELHEYAKAAQDYSSAITLNPDDASAYGNRGWSFRHLGMDDLAFRDWKTCDRLLSCREPLQVPQSNNHHHRRTKKVKLGAIPQKRSK